MQPFRVVVLSVLACVLVLISLQVSRFVVQDRGSKTKVSTVGTEYLKSVERNGSTPRLGDANATEMMVVFSSLKDIFKLGNTGAAANSSTSVSSTPGLWKSLLNTFISPNSSKSPDLSKQKFAHEKDYLKLHVCNEQFEAYSGAWLATKEHVLKTDSLGFNLSWVNCEMASFIHMNMFKGKRAMDDPKNADGLIIQSLDVLDFSVIHLSTFERGQKKYQKQLWPALKSPQKINAEWGDIATVRAASEYLAESVRNNKPVWLPQAKRTVAIMPFLGGAMGAGHSVLSNRYVYLEACFWSIYKLIPNIVMAVTTQADVDWGMEESGLPFLDVFLMQGLPKGASLPVATTQETKRRLISGKLDFDYVFYTESDHILLWRDPLYFYNYLKQYPGHMLLPHRLMAYAPRVIEEVHLRPLSSNHVELTSGHALSTSIESWSRMSCCFPRQNCGNRKRWAHLKTAKVSSLSYMGIEVPLGHANYLDEMYRTCALRPRKGDFCP